MRKPITTTEPTAADKPKRTLSPERQVASVAARIRQNKTSGANVTAHAEARLKDLESELSDLQKLTAPDVWKMAVEMAEKFGA